ncbi:hypothetical protein DC025_14720, partial [Enterococcus faecalis]
RRRPRAAVGRVELQPQREQLAVRGVLGRDPARQPLRARVEGGRQRAQGVVLQLGPDARRHAVELAHVLLDGAGVAEEVAQGPGARRLLALDAPHELGGQAR